MSFGLVIWLITFQLIPTYSANLNLSHPVDHDFGQWGDWEKCPAGTFAAGFQLKIDMDSPQYQNCNSTGCKLQDKDNTGVNGIRLICSRIGENKFTKERPSSLFGGNGEWDGGFYCDYGVITGFQVRSGVYNKDKDNVGIVNLKVQCVGAESKRTWIEGDSHDTDRPTEYRGSR